MADQNEYEQQRLQRIEENKRRMAEIGLLDSVAEMNKPATTGTNLPAVPKPRKRKTYHIEVETRRSTRLQGAAPEGFTDEDYLRRMGIDRLDLLAPMRRRRVNVDPETLKRLREERMAGGQGEEAGFDSGAGVRIQGGRVYDSVLGKTCHWCRQKTLEDHVDCTREDCGEGRKLPVSFCRMCLLNRHGEDIKQAMASGSWVCPPCRGSCGTGCTSCCNCGPCRKKAGLGPTHQVIKEARAAGFDNVHDFLVYRSTKETPEVIAARKNSATHSWAAWLDVPYEPPVSEDEETVSIDPVGKAADDGPPTVTKKAAKEDDDSADENKQGGENIADASNMKSTGVKEGAASPEKSRRSSGRFSGEGRCASVGGATN